MSTEYRCGKCGSENLRVYQDGSGFCLNCNDVFADINERLSNAVEKMPTPTGYFRYDFEISLTERDAASLITHTFRMHPLVKGNRYFLHVLFSVLLFLAFALPSQVDSRMILLIASLWIPVIIFEVMGVTGLLGRVRMRIKPTPTLFLMGVSQALTIDNEFLHQKTPMGTWKAHWALVEYIISDSDYVYLYFYNRACLLIPHRLFENREETGKFIQRAMDAQRNGKEKYDALVRDGVIQDVRSFKRFFNFAVVALYSTSLFFLVSSGMFLALIPDFRMFQISAVASLSMTLLGLLFLRKEMVLLRIVTAATFLLVLSLFGGILGIFLLSYVGALLAIPALVASVCAFTRRKYGWVIMASLFSIILGAMLSLMTFYFLLMSLTIPLLLYNTESDFKD
ncbi:MAG: YcxB family protein [Thermoplasmata archaeon]